MAWLSTTEWVDGRSGSLNEFQVREYGRVFTVEFSSRLDGPDDAIAAPGVPRIYEPYVPPSGQQDLAALVRLITPEKTDSPLIWRVTVKYSSDVDSLLNANPLLRPPEVSYSAIDVATPVLWDVEGKAVKSAAGVPFDPPLERDEARLVIRISRNLPNYDALAVLPYKNAINTRPFLGLRSYSTKAVRIEGTRVMEQGKLFWRWDCEFHARVLKEPAKANRKRVTPLAKDEQPDSYRSWTAWVLNQGYMQKKAGKLVPCLTATGQPVTAPVPLDFDGTQLALDQEPKFLGFDHLAEANLNDLGIL